MFKEINKNELREDLRCLNLLLKPYGRNSVFDIRVFSDRFIQDFENMDFNRREESPNLPTADENKLLKVLVDYNDEMFQDFKDYALIFDPSQTENYTKQEIAELINKKTTFLLDMAKALQMNASVLYKYFGVSIKYPVLGQDYKSMNGWHVAINGVSEGKITYVNNPAYFHDKKGCYRFAEVLVEKNDIETIEDEELDRLISSL